ncbi:MULTISPECIES: hypothetical protein [unclassified Gordonia (in: high G+C Gram-positive bacteria)]
MTAERARIPTPPTLAVPDELSRLVRTLAPDVWPTADVGSLLDCAHGLRARASELGAIAADIVTAHHGVEGAGRFHDEMVTAGSHLGSDAGAVRAAAIRLAAAADALETYAAASTAAHNEMSVITAIADRDRLVGEVSAALGDDSAAVMAASTGRYALSAAGDGYVEQARDAGRPGEHHSDDPQGQAATSGYMPMGAMGGLGAMGGAALGGALGSGARGTIGTGAGGAGTVDPRHLVARAIALHASLPTPVRDWLRVAVGVGEKVGGDRQIVVATSDPQPYQRPGFAIGAHEGLTADGQEPELAVVAHFEASAVATLAIGASTPMPPHVRSVLAADGIDADAPHPARA